MNRELLLVFDSLRPALDRLAREPRPDRLALLPLTSDPAVVDSVRRKAELSGASVSLLDGGALVEDEAAVLARALPAWGAALGRAAAGAGTPRSRLFRNELGLSAWWFGLLAERNPLKTAEYLRLAQLRAVRAAQAARSGARLVVAVEDAGLRAVLSREPAPAGDGARRILQAAALWARSSLKGLAARAVLGPAARRSPGPGGLVLAGYYPSLDAAAAAGGRFVNRYGPELQDLAGSVPGGAGWVMTSVPMNGLGWCDGLFAARRFNAGGERLFLIEEFLTLTDAAAALGLWMSLRREAARVLAELSPADLHAEPFGPAGEPLLRALWRRSFSGAPLMEGILAALAWRRAFAALRPGRCVYWSEMLGWEAALVAAARAAQTRCVGFQHGSLLGSCYNYFRDPTDGAGGRDALPLPDVYAADGEVPEALLAPCGYPGLTRAEAVRYLPLAAALAAPVPAFPAEPTLLVAGSIDPAETLRLVRLAARAFPVDGPVRLLFKGHPATPIADILVREGLTARPGCSVAGGSLGEALAASHAVLAGSSGAGLEALAYGREVLVPSRPDALPMSPLWGLDAPRRSVRTFEDLSAQFLECAAGRRQGGVEEGRAFLRRYWDLDPGLPRWRRILGLA